MFKISDKVTTRNYGVCVIENIVERSFGGELKKYYTLETLYKTNPKASMKVHIPFERAEEQMRHVLDKKAVLDLISTFDSIKTIEIKDAKIRKNVFEELYKTGDIEKHCQLIKSLYLLDIDLKTRSKLLPYRDKEYFEKLKATVYHEFANALCMDPNEVEDYIETSIHKDAE